MIKKIGIPLTLLVVIVLLGMFFIDPVRQEMPPPDMSPSIGVEGNRITIFVGEFPEVVPRIGDEALIVIEDFGWNRESVEDDVGKLEEFDGTLLILNIGGDFFIEMAIESGKITTVESENDLRYKYRTTAEPLE